jgi:hypothetical protein
LTPRRSGDQASRAPGGIPDSAGPRPWPPAEGWKGRGYSHNHRHHYTHPATSVHPPLHKHEALGVHNGHGVGGSAHFHAPSHPHPVPEGRRHLARRRSHPSHDDRRFPHGWDPLATPDDLSSPPPFGAFPHPPLDDLGASALQAPCQLAEKSSPLIGAHRRASSAERGPPSRGPGHVRWGGGEGPYAAQRRHASLEEGGSPLEAYPHFAPDDRRQPARFLAGPARDRDLPLDTHVDPCGEGLRQPLRSYSPPSRRGSAPAPGILLDAALAERGPHPPPPLDVRSHGESQSPLRSHPLPPQAEAEPPRDAPPHALADGHRSPLRSHPLAPQDDRGISADHPQEAGGVPRGAPWDHTSDGLSLPPEERMSSVGRILVERAAPERHEGAGWVGSGSSDGVSLLVGSLGLRM